MANWVHPDSFDITAHVRPGDRILWTQGMGEPQTLVEKLVEARHRLAPLRLVLGANYSDLIRPDYRDTFQMTGFGGVGASRALVDAGAMEVIPCRLSDLWRFLEEGTIGVDVVMMQVSGPDASGRISPGPVNGYVQAALRRARTALVEVNAAAPWTWSSDAFDLERFDAVIPTDRKLVEIKGRTFGEIERRIAANIAPHVPDGATLQIGIGAIPNAVFAALQHHRNLGIHSGVIGDGLVDLYEAGAITNAKKTRDTGVTVTGGLVGSRRIIEFADRNSLLRVESVKLTHSPRILADHAALTAINSAIEVDVTGQVGAEIAGRSYVGTVGGMPDFVRGAMMSPGGRSIIGLPSRTERGRPRIVSRIRSGVVTCPRSDADMIVTEHGTANLRAQSLDERIRRMVAIAHPDDRESLLRELRETV